MKIVALEPAPEAVTLVVVVQGADDQPEVVLRDTYRFPAGADRPSALADVRSRVNTLVTNQKPDRVIIKPLEPFALKAGGRARPNMSWFHTAEVRGVVAEASHAADARTEFRAAAKVNSTVGSRKRDDYVDDDEFWSSLGGEALPKSHRAVALLAISALRELAEHGDRAADGAPSRSA